MAKKQIARILLAKLEVVGEKSDSLSGCSPVYSLATSRLRRSQIASFESFIFSLQVLTNLALKVFFARVWPIQLEGSVLRSVLKCK